MAFRRLPAEVAKAVHYSLRLKPDLKACTFKGWMRVDLEVGGGGASEIVCNAAELEVQSVTVGEASIPKDNITLDAKAETLTVKLTEALKPGPSKMNVAFTGILNDQMKGFYRSKYTDLNGVEQNAATTQFEATDARRCFPCWDEPAIKSTFSISVIAPKDRTCLSNMPEIPKSDDQLDEWTKDEITPEVRLVNFDKTPIMSTYLLAIIVGEFECIETKTKDNILVRSFTQKGKLEQGKFALETSRRALEYYTDFFNVGYPLPKYDCIAIADFSTGAMENWGLVTFRESCVLVDPKNTSASNKQWVAIVVNHEMAHQWFGNLVTMEWWTHLWLNEGFASFMENLCSDALFPEYDLWTQFVANTLMGALELDALDSSHPIEVPVNHPSEVEEIFDNISYNKGASVIRMLFDYIGNDAFRRGMNKYLNLYSYKNAQTPDLWACLEEAAQKPVSKVMSTWTSQMGFPVLTVSKVEQRGTSTVMTISQEKFTSNGQPPSESYHWNVPITAINSQGVSQNFLMEDKTMELVFENNDSATSWVKLNSGFIGYYRVQYPEEYVARFTADIESKKLSESDRLNILDDLFALVECGRVSAVVPLKMLSSFKADTSYPVWMCIANFFGKLRVILQDEDCFPAYRRFIVSTMSEVLESVGWEAKEGEHHTTTLLRSLLISTCGVNGHEGTLAEARRRLKEHVSKNSEIPADLRNAVYRTAMAHGNEETFEQMLKLFKDEDLHEEKDRIGRAMAQCENEDILRKVLAFAIGDDVRSQDSPFILCSAANNHKGRDMTWDFFTANFDMLNKRYAGGHLLSRMIKGVTANFNTDERASEIKKYFEPHPTLAERSVRQSVEGIKVNASWRQRDGASLREFLASA